MRPPVQRGVYYAYANVWSPVARRARAAVAVADSVKLWWNGKQALALHTHPPFVNLRDPWSQRVDIEVAAGWNQVLVKIGPAKSGATGFLFRITDGEGNTLRDLVYTRDRVKPEAQPRRVRLTVATPPGTAPRQTVWDLDESEIPERPVEFTPQTAPFALRCWTDTALAWYSGSALYETSFQIPLLAVQQRVWLDLGEVGLAAEVWLNGERVGSRAWRPFLFEVTRQIRSGMNRLRVRVANSSAGQMAQGDPIYERNAWGVRFASERDRLRTLHPNGLEGPVRILVE